jgi:hypothetical protein
MPLRIVLSEAKDLPTPELVWAATSRAAERSFGRQEAPSG